MPNDEIEERTYLVLAKVAKHLTDEELSLLCWHCGVTLYKPWVTLDEPVETPYPRFTKRRDNGLSGPEKD